MSSEQQGPGHGDGHADGHSGEHALGHVHAQLGSVDYLVDLRAGRHRLQSDEPPSAGGGGAAPGPFALLLSGLVACTAITLRMYAQRKGWPLRQVEVDARMTQEGDAPRIERSVTLHGELDEAQVARLLEISEKTPVTKVVKAGAAVHTRVQRGGAA